MFASNFEIRDKQELMEMFRRGPSYTGIIQAAAEDDVLLIFSQVCSKVQIKQQKRYNTHYLQLYIPLQKYTSTHKKDMHGNPQQILFCHSYSFQTYPFHSHSI